VVDLHVVDGRIARIVPHGRGTADATAEVVELDGYLLLPSLVEPHAHLDKAFTAEAVPNADG
jgi:cytosine deaminase